MGQTFGDKGNVLKSSSGPVKIDGGAEGAQLEPPADLMERDPDLYGDLADAERIAAVAAGDDDVAKPEVIEPEDVARLDRNPETKAALVVADPSNAVALVVRWSIDVDSDEVWAHDFLEFEGDKLGIRLPQRQALAAFSLASSKYVTLGVKNDLTGLFIARHLSPDSYGRVFSRLMDPDDSAYTVATVVDLFNAIVTAAIEADNDE